MWDIRYAEPGFAYGTEPNDFLAASAPSIPVGRALCLAEGEGRNAVFLAKLGWSCHCVDGSAVGLAKAQALAQAHGLTLETEVCDLANFSFQPESYDLVTSVWCHLPPELRVRVHGEVVRALKPGGILLLEAYRPKQLEYKTGGPPSLPMLMTLDGLKQELTGLEFVIGHELDREIHEGPYHNGISAVVQVCARKPLAAGA